jgi:hypothetical protein
MKKQRVILFNVSAVRWFDKVNGNTYHSVNIERIKDGKIFVSDPVVYGYGEHYKQTALAIMFENNLLPKKYNKDNYRMYERENNYPIIWNVSDGLKRDMIANVK